MLVVPHPISVIFLTQFVKTIASFLDTVALVRNVCSRMITHRRPVIQGHQDVEARPVVLIGIGLVHEVGGQDSGDVLLVVGQGLVMEHVRPTEVWRKTSQFLRLGNDPAPCTTVSFAATIIVQHDLFD